MEFSELVGHLDDLIDLARSEGFDHFAGLLWNAKAKMEQQRSVYTLRNQTPGEIARAAAAAAKGDAFERGDDGRLRPRLVPRPVDPKAP